MLAAVLYFCWCLLAVQAQFSVTDEDDTCRQKGVMQATCMRLSQCSRALADLKLGKLPKTCSFEGDEPHVCCQPSLLPQDINTSQNNLKVQTKPGTETSPKPQATLNPEESSDKQETARFSIKSKQKCEEYAKAVFINVEDINGEEQIVDTCGINNVSLSESYTSPTQPRAYPHMVLIGYGGRNDITWLCGGSLISERFVLSSARCADGGRRGPAKWVRLGDHDIASMEDDYNDKAGSREYEIIQIITHPEFRRSSAYNNIALYKMVTNVQFSEYIRPICLHTEHKIAENSAIYTTWEEVKKSEESGSVLKEINLDIIGGRECNNSFSASLLNKLTNGIIDSSMMCATRRNEKDSCTKMNSGGPLQIRLSKPYCMYSQLGLDSIDEPCVANSPTAFTRVSNYVPWIETIVWP